MPQNRPRWPRNAFGGEFGMEMPDLARAAHVANVEKTCECCKIRIGQDCTVMVGCEEGRESDLYSASRGSAIYPM